MSEITKADEIKIAEYRATCGKYARPSVTADILALRPAYGELQADQWRENPKFVLEALLIRRGQWPYEGCWALPGGFIHPDESVDEGARRELREETALKAHPLIPVGVFSDPKRDLRTWVISNAFVSVYHRGEGCHVKGGDDAAAAQWLRVEALQFRDGRFALPFSAGEKPLFTLTGVYCAEAFGGGTVKTVNPNPLAFDHARIIAQAFLRLLAFDLNQLAFLFLPEKFTLADYIGVYSYLAGVTLDPAGIPNFRRQLTQTKNPLLEVCPGEFAAYEGRGHATAKLYRKRV